MYKVCDKMRVLISALILILVLHFLLDSISYRKQLNMCPYQERFRDDLKKSKKVKFDSDVRVINEESAQENYSNVIFTNGQYVKAAPPESCFRETENVTYQPKQELMDYLQCNKPGIQASNIYVSDQNDANFQSNVMNLTRFYEAGAGNNQPPPMQPQQQQMAQPAPGGTPSGQGVDYSLTPDTWRYENELPMNGGAVLPGVSGFDNNSDFLTPYNDMGPGAPLDSMGCAPPSRGAQQEDDLRMGMGSLNAPIRATQ